MRTQILKTSVYPSDRGLVSATVVACCLVCLTGCRFDEPYRFGRKQDSGNPYGSMVTSISSGIHDHPRLDAVEQTVFTPIERTASLFRRKDAPSVPLDTRREQAFLQAAEFLSQNDLTDIHVAVRDYQPADQWRRLRENQDVHSFWKYTDGSLRVLTSTLFPERVFRLDRYNPHTKTLHLNSGKAARSVYASATAKEFLGSETPGLYAATQYVPLLPVWQQFNVSRDAITYAKVRGDWPLEKDLYPTAYSRMGSSILSDTYSLLPGTGGAPFFVAPAVSVAGRIAGRSVGSWQARQAGEEQESE